MKMYSDQNSLNWTTVEPEHTPDYECALRLCQNAAFSQDVLSLTAVEDQLLLKDPHGEKTLHVAL